MNMLSTTFDPWRWVDDPRSDMCEHVEANADTAYAVFREDDSFGPVMRSVVCQQCWQAAQEEEALEACKDCGQRKKNSAMRTWKWYDFYAPQGDTPLNICRECWDKPKHRERRRADAEAAEAESALRQRRLGYYY